MLKSVSGEEETGIHWLY